MPRKPREGPKPKSVNLRIEPEFYEQLKRAAYATWYNEPDAFSKNSVSGYVIKLLRTHQEQIENGAAAYADIKGLPARDRSNKHLSPQSVIKRRKKVVIKRRK